MTTATQVKEHPILMHARSVRGILEGNKRQTRRIVKPQPPTVEAVQTLSGSTFSYYRNELGDFSVAGPVWAVRQLGGPQHLCPRYRIGEHLWVRETWAVRPAWDDMKPSEIPKGYALYYYAEDSEVAVTKWRPSIFMPRWACRLVLEITNIRVERVQDISEEDALAEGSYLNRCSCPRDEPKSAHTIEAMFRQTGCHLHGNEFKQLWDDTNGKGAWERNDWVWCISFKRTR